MKTLRFLIVIMCSLWCTFLGAQDTLNQIDVNGKKQGWWQIRGNDKMYTGKEYSPDAVVEEGKYNEGKKTGVWRQYYKGGNIRSEVEYQLGRPSGSFKIYYEESNGCLEEKGKWKNGAYCDTLVLYSKDTCNKLIKSIMFDETLHQGKSRSMNYESMNKNHENLIKGVFERSIDTVKQQQPKEKNCFGGNGSTNKRLDEDGEFKNGKLWNGKKYIYDKQGLLLRIEIYKEGKYVADGQLDGL